MTLDFSGLLKTLSKLTDGRILPFVETQTVDDVFIAKIPVTRGEPEDRKSGRISRYIRDWILLRTEKTGVDCIFEKFPERMIYTTPEGEAIEVEGALVITCWPRPEGPEYQSLIDRQKG